MANPLRHELRNPVIEASETRSVLHVVTIDSIETKTRFEQWCDDGLHSFELEDALKARAMALHAEAWAALIGRLSASVTKAFRRASVVDETASEITERLDERAVGGTIVGGIGTDRDERLMAAQVALEKLWHRGYL